MKRQDAVSLQIDPSELLTSTTKMITTIIFVDNLFRIEYVSVYAKFMRA
jgi:hypothetical protein